MSSTSDMSIHDISDALEELVTSGAIILRNLDEELRYPKLSKENAIMLEKFYRQLRALRWASKQATRLSCEQLLKEDEEEQSLKEGH